MSKVSKTASRTLRVESITSSTGSIDVSVLRDFVKTLDEHGIDGRAQVTGHRSGPGHLICLSVTVHEPVDYDTAERAAREG